MIISHKAIIQINPVLCIRHFPHQTESYTLLDIEHTGYCWHNWSFRTTKQKKPSLYLLNVSLMHKAIQTKEIAEMKFRSHTISITIARQIK